MSVSCRHLNISIGSMSWMEVNFLTSIHVCHYVQTFSNLVLFFRVTLNESRCIFAFGPSSSPSNSFPMLFIHSAFLLCSLRSYICSKIVLFPYHTVVGMCWCIHPLLADRIFFLCFGMSCFVCIVLFCRYLFSLPSFASNFWFISFFCIVCFYFLSCFFFSSQHVPAFFFCFIFFAYSRRFVINVSSQISHLDFEFLFVFFRRTLISLQYRLVCLIPLCFSLK